MSEQKSHKQILRSSSIIGGASVINIIISLLRNKALAMLLGPTGIGLLGLLQNLMGTASAISALGFGTVGTRQIAEASGREDQSAIDAARRALFWGTLILAIIGGTTFWALRHILAEIVMGDPSKAGSIGWLAVGVTLSVASGSQGALLNGMRRIGDIAKMQIYSAVLSTIIGIAIIWVLGEKGLLLFILAVPFSGFVVGHLFVAKLPRIQTQKTALSILFSQWKTMASLGFSFMIAGLALALGMLLVRTIIQRDLGPHDLGYFQAAWAISMTCLGFVLGAMGTDYYPRLTAAMHNPVTANRLVNEQTEVALLLAGPVLLAMLALAPWVIQTLYTAEFVPAIAILRWQILGDILKITSWPLGFVILAAGDGRTYMLTESAAMAMFVIATYLTLPLMGITATGLSFLAMYVLYLPLVYWLAHRRTGFIWSSMVKRDFILLLTTAAMIALAGNWHDWLGAVLGLLASAIFGLMALVRLATMAELTGRVGKLANIIKPWLRKMGLIHE